MQYIGNITDKKQYAGTSEKGPAGTIFVNSRKFTCWDKDLFNKINVGEELTLEYSEQENTYEGKTYMNRSVISIVEKDNNEQNTPETIHINNSDISTESEPFTLNGLTYKIVTKLVQQ